MDSNVIVWLMIVVFFVTESSLRKGENAKSYSAGATDQKTSFRLGLTYGIMITATLLAPLLNSYQIGLIVGLPALRWIGIGVLLGGFALHVWAMRVLGQFYTRTLRTSLDQQIVQQGPYHLIRHPGYLGSLSFWIGGGLATTNWIVAGAIIILLLSAYISRIQAEEAMLLATFGQAYREYSRQTWRLLPFVF
jgi:protein-S-isoprenylcysteine O-methyltransferase Ste14